MTVRAIYENGVFRPTEPVNLPERSEVEIVLPAAKAVDEVDERKSQKEIFALLRRSYATGQKDTAARHNEHQP